MSNTSQNYRQKVFLSYAHKVDGNPDHTADLVNAIQKRLEKAGLEVWIDLQQLHPGRDWRDGITRGIHESDRVLSFLSPRSVRDPGVCLDEIGIAMSHKHGAIATLLADKDVESKIPASVAHIQYLDVSDWTKVIGQDEETWSAWLDGVVGEILAIIIANQGFAGEIQDLQRILCPMPDSAKIGRLVENGLIGRLWVKEAISDWRITNSNQRMFWLVGEPGIGKSALAADLVHKAKLQVVAYHFCDYQVAESRTAHRFVCNLAFMLSARLPDYRRLLLSSLAILPKSIMEMTATELMERLLINALKNKIDGGLSNDRLLLVIDALDEADAELVNILVSYLDALPRWLGVVVTSRPEINIALARNPAFEIRMDDPRNLEDLHAYLDDWQQADPQAPLSAETRNALVDGSQGNMLYLALAREGYCRGLFSLDAPSRLPKGLGEVYLEWMRRQFTGDPLSHPSWSSLCYAFLELLCASPEPLPQTLASRLLNWKGQDRLLALRPLGSLVKQEGDTWRLCHRSLGEWLTDTNLLHNYWINLEDGRSKLLHGLLPLLSGSLAVDIPSYIHRAIPELLSLLDAQQSSNFLETNRSEILRLLGMLGDFWERFSNVRAWSMQEKLFSWLVSQFECMPEIYVKDRAHYLFKFGNVLLNQGKYMQAVEKLQEANDLQLAVLGPVHPVALSCQRSLSLALYGQGNYAAAASLQEQELKVREKQADVDFSELLIAKSNLARSRYAEGHYEQAKQLHQEVLATQNLHMGEQDPRTIGSISALSSALFALGEVSAAEVLNIKVLDFSRRTFGKDHPKTITSASYLASTYFTLGRFLEAKELQQEVLLQREHTLGKAHPDTLLANGALALTVRSLGEIELARQMQLELLPKIVEALGALHPSTLFQQCFFADTCFNLSDYAQAKTLQEYVVLQRSKVLRVDHPDTLVAKASLAMSLSMIGHLDSAKALLLYVVDAMDVVLGTSHPDTIFSYKLLLEILRKCNDMEKISAIQERINPDKTDLIDRRPVHYTNNFLISKY